MRNSSVILTLALAACSAPRQTSPRPAPAAAEPAVAEPVTAAPAQEAEATPAATKEPCTPPAETAGPPPVEDPLAELSALGDEVLAGGPDAGGSIRAKREPPLDRVRADPCRVRARVEKIVRGRFPLAAVSVRILEPPKEGPGVGLGKNDEIVVLPRVVAVRGRVRMEDPVTARNGSAFYLTRGDRVHLLLESERADGVWWAEAIARD